MTTNVLATLNFRETFPGIGNLLQAVNQLLDSGNYHIRQTLNPAHPKHLYLDVFGKKTSHCTLKLDIPLDPCTTSEITLSDLCKKLNSSTSIRLIANDETVIFCTGSAAYSTSSQAELETIDANSIVLEHTFILRKPVPCFDCLLSCMCIMANELNYQLICSSDPQTHRWLEINLFHHDFLHPIAVCSRRLKAPKKTDLAVLSKINMASSHGASIIFKYNENDASIVARIVEPKSPNRLHHLLLALQLL